MYQLTDDFYLIGEVLSHTLAGIGASLGMSMNFEAVTARHAYVRLERKKKCWTPTMPLSPPRTKAKASKNVKGKAEKKRRNKAVNS